MAGKKNDDILTTSSTNYIEERNYILRDVPYRKIRRAWFTMSHLLLDDNARVVDMGCGTGEQTFAMAAMNQNMSFIGVDKSKKTITEAQSKFTLPNLEFKIGDMSSDVFEPESVDAIINSFTLHHVFSDSRYNERVVSDTLRKQFSMLKNDGVMFIRDFAKPQQGEFVLLEMHDEPSTGKSLADMSEADLLVWYSEHARPKQDPGCGGFFLEELPPRFPYTRLFRLPYKWAYEFIMRKDNRDVWENELPFEYTFYTVQEFRNELSSQGARMQYSAPHWDDEYIRTNFDGHFRLLQMNGDQIGDPPTSFIAVARKLPERSSLNVKERRVTNDDDGILQIKTLRDQKNGDLVDVVTRDKELAEILPYRIDNSGRLYIYLHEGILRGIVNTVRRSGSNIDGREWSGHMLETITTNYTDILELGPFDVENTKEFTKSYIGLNTAYNSVIEEGNTYYPDPNFIDERVHTYYISTHGNKKDIAPKRKILENNHFQTKGMITEFNAQTVLDAITIGLIPNSRLELQILSLMQHLNIKAENWISKDIDVASGDIGDRAFKVREFLRQTSNNDKRFKEVKGPAGQLRRVNSIFVEEGQSQGGRTGISSEHVDFVLSDDKTINTAVILPITKSTKGDLHAGFMVKHMPVPQRYEGNGLSVSVPQINIPKEITNYRMLKQFIAEKYGVTPDMVLKLGESYFTHIGITPQRIHPFAVTSAPHKFSDPGITFIPFYQYMLLWKSLSKEQHFMTTVARAYRYLPEHMRLQAKRDVKVILEDMFRSAQPDWSMPESIAPSKAHAPHKDSSLSDAAPPPDGSDQKKASWLSDIKAKDESKKEQKKKRKLGLTHDKGKHLNEGSSGVESDPDEIEEDNKETKKRNILDINLIEEFEREMDDIRDVLEEDQDNEPRPEKW